LTTRINKNIIFETVEKVLNGLESSGRTGCASRVWNWEKSNRSIP
jgi:hypothetical protein